MWSHYSLEHTGICFGIKMPYDSENDNEMIVTKSVVYDSIIKSHNPLIKDNEKTVLGLYNWIFGKSDVWGYEKEIRTFISKNNLARNIESLAYEYRPFPKEALVEMHYGLRTSQSDIVEIERLIQENGYNNILKRYKIEKIKGTYNIERKLIS